MWSRSVYCGLYSVDQRCVALNQAAFHGVGGSLTCAGNTPNENTEDELKRFLEESISDLHMPMVLVSHHHPFNTIVDRVRNGIQVGSNSV